MPVTVEDIRDAAAAIAGNVTRTPAIAAPALSDLTGADVVLKLENLQPTGSFKVRGAFWKLAGLGAEEKNKGVVAQSAGNHAQGVAYHARRMGIPVTIVMPENTPFQKVSGTEQLGARVIIEGASLAEARDAALMLAEKEGLHFVHPYDDPRIIAGQGTIGLELLADHPDLDALIVPIGGGGLIAGVAIAAKALKPEIELFGVEAALYPSMREILKGKDITAGGETVAEGIAVVNPGALTREVVAGLVADIFLVEEAAIERAMQLFVTGQRVVAEGAGAAPLAALLQNRERFAGRRIGLIVSGGNVDARLLSSVLMRGLVREGRLARLRIEISDAPGALAEIAEIIGAHGGNIVEVYHQRLFYDVPVKSAELDVILETRDAGHVNDVIAALEQAGFPTRHLSATLSGETGPA